MHCLICRDPYNNIITPFSFDVRSEKNADDEKNGNFFM